MLLKRVALSCLASMAACVIGCGTPMSPLGQPPPSPGETQIAQADFYSFHTEATAKWKISANTETAVITLGGDNPSTSDVLDSTYAFALTSARQHRVTATVEYQIKPNVSGGPGTPLIGLSQISWHNEQGFSVLPVLLYLYHPPAGDPPEAWHVAGTFDVGTFSGADLNSPTFGLRLRAAVASDSVASAAVRIRLRAQEE